MDLLWPAQPTIDTVKEMMPKGTALMAKVTRWYLTRHITNILADGNANQPKGPSPCPPPRSLIILIFAVFFE